MFIHVQSSRDEKKKIHMLCCKEQLHSHLETQSRGKGTPPVPPWRVGIPGCADARSGSHPWYTCGWREICNPPWPAATQNGGWSAQKLYAGETKEKSQPDSYFHSANNNSWISAAETNTWCWSLMPENGIQSWIIFSCSYNIPGVFSLFLTLIHSLCRKVFPWP